MLIGFVICTAHWILWRLSNQNSEMGVACSTYGGEERWVQCLVGKPKVKRPRRKSRLL
jgi:hypothetical protein